MTRTFISSMLIAAMLPLFVLSPIFVPATSASAAVGDWQKGASFQPRWDTDFGSDTFKQSLRDFKAAGGTHAVFIIPYYQSNIWSTDIQRGWNTPTDDSLAAGIGFAHSIGMKVVLKPHLDSYDGQWRAHIHPGDRDGWFTNYKNMLMKYAQMGAAHGAEEMVVGTELIDMATASSNGDNTARWQNMIGAVRAVYGGKLTYSSNWGGDDFAEETPDIAFWGSLDYIGISAYYPLNQWGSGDVNSLMGSWDNWNNSKIKWISQQYGKPVLFTEIGYRSVSGAHNQPWDSWSGGGYDGEEQVNDYTALFQYWNNQSFMQGIFIWDWTSDPNAGWPGDIHYTPQHKPALDTIKQWFGSAPAFNPTPTPAPTSTPPAAQGDFGATGSANPAAVNKGQPVSLKADVTSKSASTNDIVDLEVWSSGGSKVFQKFYEGQNFAAGTPQSYNASYTLDTEGSYTLKLGVFNSNWSQNYLWGDIGNFSVQGSTPPTTPAAFTASSASVTPGTSAPGSTVAVSAQVTNGNSAASGIIVDVEIYDGSGAKVGQKVFENESFVANQTKDYSMPFTSSSAGTYTVKIGVFSSGWSQNYIWNDAAATFKAETAAPAPGPASVNIWWPGDGAHITGVQPFKADVPGFDVSSYNMVWQVDGDRENPMDTNMTDYPHKEALVDVSGWTWKGPGASYSVTFTAKNGSGTTMATKSVNIFTQ